MRTILLLLPKRITLLRSRRCLTSIGDGLACGVRRDRAERSRG